MCAFVCVYVYVCGGSVFFTICWSAPSNRDPWAMVISRLMLIAFIELNSVYQAQDMLPDGVTWNVPILYLGLGLTSLSDLYLGQKQI